MSFEEEVGRVRGEVAQRITAGIGLIAQGLDGLSSVLHRTAQALEQISETLVSQAVDEEFGEHEEDEDAKDYEDDETEEDDGVMDDLDTPSWMGPDAPPPPPAPDVTGIAEPPHAEPYGQTYEAPTIQEHHNPFGTH
jgi:hypothetical protein